MGIKSNKRNLQQSRFLAYPLLTIVIVIAAVVVLITGLLLLRFQKPKNIVFSTGALTSFQDVKHQSARQNMAIIFEKSVNEGEQRSVNEKEQETLLNTPDNIDKIFRLLEKDAQIDKRWRGDGILVYEEIGVTLDKKRGIIIADGKEYPIEKLAGTNKVDGVVYPAFFDIPVRIVTKGKVTLSPEEIASQRSLIAHILQTFSNLSEEEKKEIDSWRNFLDRMERTGGYETDAAFGWVVGRGTPGSDGIPLDFVPPQDPILRENKNKKGHVTQYQKNGLPKSERVSDRVIEPKTAQFQTSLADGEYDEVVDKVLDEYFEIMAQKSDDKFYKEVPYSMDVVVEESDIMKSSNFKTEERYRALLSEFSDSPPMERKIEIWRQLVEMWRQDKSHSSPK